VLGALNFVPHRRTFLNRSNRRSIIQWYFTLKRSLLRRLQQQQQQCRELQEREKHLQRERSVIIINDFCYKRLDRRQTQQEQAQQQQVWPQQMF